MYRFCCHSLEMHGDNIKPFRFLIKPGNLGGGRGGGRQHTNEMQTLKPICYYILPTSATTNEQKQSPTFL